MVQYSEDLPQLHAETAEQWRDWLVENHAREREVWLVTWRASTGRSTVGYEESVLEALAVGWIDSQYAPVDAERSMQRYSPRRPGSPWSRPNKDRVTLLEAEGRMLPAGRAVIDAAMRDGSWSYLDDVDNLVVPPDLAEALAAHPGAREHWDAFAGTPRRIILRWILDAKRGPTRAARIDETARLAAEGVAAHQPPRRLQLR